MNRSIQVSTEVFAAIWAQREEGEETEDSVLRRILSAKAAAPASVAVGSGVYDFRNDISFTEGFEIFRTYKGQKYSATARGGVWLRADNGVGYATLNQLNRSIAAGSENVWNGNWKYRKASGGIASIADLRT